jgi:uncharacterized phage infection (PIP) family protein YhgE
MPNLEGESTSKFRNLLKTRFKTPWRRIKSTISHLFTRKNPGSNSSGLPPVKHSLGSVYEGNLGNVGVPTNRGGLQNYIKDLANQKQQLLDNLQKLRDENKLTKDIREEAKAQIARIRTLEREIRRTVKKIASNRALHVRGTVLTQEGRNRLQEIQEKQEDKIAELEDEIEEGMEELSEKVEKQHAAINKALGINSGSNGEASNEERVMPTAIVTKPISLPMSLNKPRSLPVSSKLTIRAPVAVHGGKTRRRR